MKNTKNETQVNTAGNTTELVFILDRSGSMQGLEKDTIGGFNGFIEKQRAQEGACCVSVVLFDNDSEVLYDRVKLTDVRKMTDKDYSVGGCTALIDAIGGAVKHIANIHKYARHEDVPAHTVFVIMTDGMENASRIHSSKEVKKMVEKQKEAGWEFLFIGANIDSVETAGHIGIDAEKAVNYHADKKGTRVVYEAVASAVGKMRACGRPMSREWCAEIREDYENRKS